MALKIVIENAILRGSPQEEFLQKVAAVYVNGEDKSHREAFLQKYWKKSAPAS
jgi:hypothetical protein